jgi:hypothetical protein
MLDSFFIFENTVFKTGDFVTCNHFYDKYYIISDARIYICSAEEAVIVTNNHGFYDVIIFVCNNVSNHYTGSFNCPRFGYKYRLVSGLFKNNYNTLGCWSDCMTNLKKLYIKDNLSFPIDVMIMKDKQSINNGVLKL